jgi:hypothetical protein
VPLAGTIHDQQIDFTVSWAWGGDGHYTATFTPAGQLSEGFTRNLSMPSSTATWTATSIFKCMTFKERWRDFFASR